MEANKKSRACINEWLGEDETISVQFAMDEQLTNALEWAGKKIDRKKQEEIVSFYMKSVKIEFFGKDNVLMKSFTDTIRNGFTFVTEDHQVLNICVANSADKSITIGRICMVWG